MADPLSLLRQYLIHGKEMVTHDECICFDEYCWPKDVKTNYKIYSTSRGPNISYYTLECLLYFHQNTRLSYPTYVKKASSCGIPVVEHSDRKDLLAYLSDENYNSASIDRSAPIELPINMLQLMNEAHPVGVKRAVGEEEVFASSKLARLDEMSMTRKQFTDHLNGNEQTFAAERATAPTEDEDAEYVATIHKEIAALKAKQLVKNRNKTIDSENEFDSSQAFSGSTGDSIDPRPLFPDIIDNDPPNFDQENDNNDNNMEENNVLSKGDPDSKWDLSVLINHRNAIMNKFKVMQSANECPTLYFEQPVEARGMLSKTINIKQQALVASAKGHASQSRYFSSSIASPSQNKANWLSKLSSQKRKK